MFLTVCRAYRQQAQRDGANELGDGDGAGHGGGDSSAISADGLAQLFGDGCDGGQ